MISLCNAVSQEISEKVVSLKEIQNARINVRKNLNLNIKKSQTYLKNFTDKAEPRIERETPVNIKKIPDKSSLKLYENE